VGVKSGVLLKGGETQLVCGFYISCVSFSSFFLLVFLTICTVLFYFVFLFTVTVMAVLVTTLVLLLLINLDLDLDMLGSNTDLY